MHVRTHVDIIIFAIDKGFNGIGKGSNAYLDRRRRCGVNYRVLKKYICIFIYAFLFMRLRIRKAHQTKGTCSYLVMRLTSVPRMFLPEIPETDNHPKRRASLSGCETSSLSPEMYFLRVRSIC